MKGEVATQIETHLPIPLAIQAAEVRRFHIEALSATQILLIYDRAKSNWQKSEFLYRIRELPSEKKALLIFRGSFVLYSSEARRHNGHLGRTNLEEPLAPLVRTDGTTSPHFPASLKVLFSYERELSVFHLFPLNSIADAPDRCQPS